MKRVRNRSETEVDVMCTSFVHKTPFTEGRSQKVFNKFDMKPSANIRALASRQDKASKIRGTRMANACLQSFATRNICKFANIANPDIKASRIPRNETLNV